MLSDGTGRVGRVRERRAMGRPQLGLAESLLASPRGNDGEDGRIDNAEDLARGDPTAGKTAQEVQVRCSSHGSAQWPGEVAWPASSGIPLTAASKMWVATVVRPQTRTSLYGKMSVRGRDAQVRRGSVSTAALRKACADQSTADLISTLTRILISYDSVRLWS